VAKTVSSDHRKLIEQVRHVNKALSLYVLALQENTALTGGDHEKLAQALRSIADAVDQEARKASARGATADHLVIDGDAGFASETNGTTTQI
jgi:hypothetical protein